MEKEAVLVKAMEMMTLRPMTEEEFVAWCDEDIKAEYVDGEVVVHTPSSTQHVLLCGFLGTLLRMHVDAHDLGIVAGPEWQVRLRPQLRRVPDLLFIAKERASIVRVAHIEGAPDLIIEIVSPDSEEILGIPRSWGQRILGNRPLLENDGHVPTGGGETLPSCRTERGNLPLRSSN
jgi:Uma2 family endonuclease